MFITKKEWNDDLVGYCCETDNGTYFQVQFEKETNRLHADFGEYYPILDTDNEYGLNLTVEEIELVKKLISKDKEFLNKAESLSNFTEY